MDGAAVAFANDSALQELGISAKGDLLAIRTFCEETFNAKVSEKVLKEETARSTVGQTQKEEIGSLKQYYRVKQGKEGHDQKSATCLASHYKPEMGRYVMVRTVGGGGTRDVYLHCDSTFNLSAAVLMYIYTFIFIHSSLKGILRTHNMTSSQLA